MTFSQHHPVWKNKFLGCTCTTMMSQNNIKIRISVKKNWPRTPKTQWETKKNLTHSKNIKKNNSCVLIQKTGCTYNIRAWDMSYVLCRKREVTRKKSLRFIAKTCIILYSKLFLTMIFIFYIIICFIHPHQSMYDEIQCHTM